MSEDALLAELPQLVADDIKACLAYACCLTSMSGTRPASEIAYW